MAGAPQSEQPQLFGSGEVEDRYLRPTVTVTYKIEVVGGTKVPNGVVVAGQ